MPSRRVSARQLEILLEFAETHRDVAMGRYTGGPLGNQATRQAWQTIALQLNAVGDGASKTAEKWRRYWVELKAKVKNKAADRRRMARGTGGGPNRLLPLTPFEERILDLIGNVAVDGLQGVQIPLNASGQSTNFDTDSPSMLRGIDNISLLSSNIDDAENNNILEDTQAVWLVEDGARGGGQRAGAEEDHTSQAGQARQPSQNRRTPRLRPTNVRQIRQDVNLPNWAYQLETRRLAIEDRQAGALNRIADALEQQTAALVRQTAVLQQVADGVTQIKNLMRVDF